MNPSPLPVELVLPDLLEAFASHSRVLLQAPPGAGKTTRVPLALWRTEPESHVIMLEPRRLAARAAARHMAGLLGERVGHTVGYRVRLESRVSPATRITVVTEGVLTRMLREDPELAGVRWLIFDEFHERHLQGDLGLALALDCQESLREPHNPLQILVMSATLDAAPLESLLAPCAVVRSLGRLWPVERRHLPPDPRVRAEVHTAAVVRRVLSEEPGSVLVFLPGAGEIRRVEGLLQESSVPGVRVHPLYGDLSPEAQDAAIAPAPAGERKVVLATSIAESSLTIEGVRVVVDAGFARFARFDPGTGMTRLVTERVSRSSADQRCGRAGRLEPGLCLRLWPLEEPLRPSPRPEVLDADLADMRLELALWGIDHASSLRWLDAPPAEAWEHATNLLVQMDALAPDAGGRLRCTSHGRALAALPVHPRVAHMLLCSGDNGRVACLLAALMGERDPLRTASSVDVRLRLGWLSGQRGHRLRELASRLESLLPRRQGRSAVNGLSDGIEDAGRLLALAYPERVAQRRPGTERGLYRLANGRGAWLSADDPLADSPFLAVGELDGGGQNARIFQAAPLALEDLRELFQGHVRTRDSVVWDSREEAVLARRQEVYEALILRESPLPDADSELCAAALARGIRSLGLTCLPWTEALQQWRSRVLFLRCLGDERFPDVRDAVLLDTLEDWLLPWASGMTRRAQFRQLDLGAALQALLPPGDTHACLRRLDDAAPETLQVPSGSRIRLSYPENLLTAAVLPSVPDSPVLAVKLQEMFGLARTPEVCGVPVLVHLLSPAGRPLQVTADLAGFWSGAYNAVRAEMRGRYPRHPWPENPLEAPPTRRTNPRKN